MKNKRNYNKKIHFRNEISSENRNKISRRSKKIIDEHSFFSKEKRDNARENNPSIVQKHKYIENYNYRYYDGKRNKSKKSTIITCGSKGNIRKYYQNRVLIVNIVYSLIILFVIESFSRMDIKQVFDFLTQFPIQFFVNYTLIFLIISISIFLKRKIFYRFIVSFILIMLSIISGILMNLRDMPLFPYDILSFKEAIKISSIFLSFKTEIVVGIVILSAIVVAILLFILEGRLVNEKYKKTQVANINKRGIIGSFERFIYKRKIGHRNILIYIVILSMYLIIVPQLSAAKITSQMAWNMTASFQKNGFTYSFLRECVLTHRKKPKGYNKETITSLREDIDKKVKNDKRQILRENKRPNIVVVQLEAFMDPTRIRGVKFNEDPIPNMRNLMKNYTSGLMRVPVTGGGTARTEYEVLSGNSFEYLNSGEIPYQTFLSEKPSESLATTLNHYGYKSVAIHNFYQRFYNRNKGLENIGFNKFVPLDVMTNVEYTPLYWPKDKILNKYIEEQINQSKEGINGKRSPRFIFTISTQGHSRYPNTRVNVDYPIKLVDSKLPVSDQNQIYYYVNQLYEMDQFVGKLVNDINKSKEPTVLVLYGDHLPALDIIKRNQAGVDKFESIFTVVNNMGGTKKIRVPKNFTSNDLSTLILKTAKLPYGPMNLVHAYYRNNKYYQKILQLVQYDILFGKKYFLKEGEEQKPNNMKIDSDELKFDKIVKKEGDFYLKGEGFNRNTVVYIDGKKVDADYYDDRTIKLYDSFYTGKKSVFLRIIDNNGNTIQQTKTIDYSF